MAAPMGRLCCLIAEVMVARTPKELNPLLIQKVNPGAKRWYWAFLLLGAAIVLIWAWFAGWPKTITEIDINQHRTNTALPAPDETSQIRQSFTSQLDGLTEVELLLVRYGAADSNGHFEVTLLDDSGQTVATQSLPSNSLSHNQPYILQFPYQKDSAGREYTLLIGGTANNDVSVWGYDLNVYGSGEAKMAGGETTAQDLRFITRYQLTTLAAVTTLADMVWSNGQLMILALALMLMPGCLLLLVVRSRRGQGQWDVAAWWGMALGLGVSVWPLLWLWLTLLGGRWSGWSLWLVLILGWGLIIVLHFVDRRRRSAEGRKPAFSIHWSHGLLLLLLFLGLSVRLLAVRDLVYPPWVDSTRHALITAVMAENGQAISDYEPLLAVERFPYHYGFHTISAGLAQLIDVPLPQLLLVLGQLLNALMPLTMYAGAFLLTRRGGVALTAAFLVALPFFFPGYYATWGRFTQLTAMLILPLAIAMTWLIVRGAKKWRQGWWLLAILIAGIFLVHFRIILLYIPFAGLVWLLSRGRNGRWLAMAAGSALILVGPRIFQLAADTQSMSVLNPAQGYNDFPSGYVMAGWERAFLWLAAASLILVLVAFLRKARWSRLPLILAIWVGLLALVLSGHRVGLPDTWLINLNSAYISLFVPLALLLAITADQVWRWLSNRHGLLRAPATILAGAGLMAALLFGLRQQINILNPETILARPQDVEGLAWIEKNTDPAAKIAVSSWRWLGNTWTGTDGGAWLVPLTGRNSTTPPADYNYDRRLFLEVKAFNEQASEVEDWSDPASADWLRTQGISYIFVGARGGYFDPGELARNPEVRQEFGRDGVFVFSLK